MQVQFSSEKRRRFAILILAHNKERLIAKTIYSLSSLVYPKKMYDLIVVADHCSDNTIYIAQELGVKVLEKNDADMHNDEFAMHWAFKKLLASDTGYDAFIVLKTNSLISANFLEVVNYYLAKGSEIVQCSNQVITNASSAWMSQLRRIQFMLSNFVRPLGNKVLGINSGPLGNGLCFTTEILKEMSLQEWPLTENNEYRIRLNLSDIPIDFAPEASVWTPLGFTEFPQINSLLNNYDLIQKYAGKFFNRFLRERSIKNLFMGIDALTPSFMGMLITAFTISALSFFLWLINIGPATYLWLWTAITVTGAAHLLIGLYVIKAEKKLYGSLYDMRRALLSKTKVLVKTVVGKNMK